MSKQAALPEQKDLDGNNKQIEKLQERIKGLTCELLQERISRIDFQGQLLTQWRQQCQQELNQLLAGQENRRNPGG